MGSFYFGNFLKAFGRALVFAAIVSGPVPTRAAVGRVAAFVAKHCVDCHEDSIRTRCRIRSIC